MSASTSTALDGEIAQLPGGGRALFTARAHGNLSSVGGEHAEHGLSARERLRESLGVRRLVRGYQVHGTVVGRVFADGATSSVSRDSACQPTFEADGHAVAASGVAAMVFTADCIPVVLGADGAVAALHAAGLPAECSRRACSLCARSAGAETSLRW
jgi:copper oxidase (laccase) domain-containing protein